MRVLIFGASGMFGHKLYQKLSPEHDVFGTIRNTFDSIDRFGIFDQRLIIENVDIFDFGSIEAAVHHSKPDVIVNAVGVVKQVPRADDVMNVLAANSVFPQRLAALSDELGLRFITISTDCVFSGEKGSYSELDLPDAKDLYGVSKYLGEVRGKRCLTIRTSIIGRELESGHSLVEWFLGNRGKSVKGYVNAIFSGFPTVIFADIIARIIADHADINGVYHVSSDPINKFELLKLLDKYYQANVVVEPYTEFTIDRSLDSSLFRKLANFSPPCWDEMIEQMSMDPTPYETWKK